MDPRISSESRLYARKEFDVIQGQYAGNLRSLHDVTFKITSIFDSSRIPSILKDRILGIRHDLEIIEEIEKSNVALVKRALK